MKKSFILRNTVKTVAVLVVFVASFALSGCKDFVSAFSDDTDITSFSFDGIVGEAVIDKSARTVTAEAEADVDLKQLVVSFGLSKGAVAKVGGTVQESGITANDFSKTVVYAVTSGSEEYTRDWKVTITQEEVEGSQQDADFVAFTFEGIDGKASIDKAAHSVTAKAGETVDLTTLVAEFTLSAGATATVGSKAQVSGQTANNFTSPVTYKVTSGDKKVTQDWTVSVTDGKTGGEPSGEFAYKGYFLGDWVKSLNFSLDFVMEDLDPEDAISVATASGTYMVKSNDYVYSYSLEANRTYGFNLWKNDEKGGLVNYHQKPNSNGWMPSADNAYNFYYIKKGTKEWKDIELEYLPDADWAIGAPLTNAIAMKSNSSGRSVIEGIMGTKVGTDVVAGQEVDIYEFSIYNLQHLRFWVMPETGLCLKTERLNSDKSKVITRHTVTRYDPNPPTLDTEEQIFNVMHTNGVQYRIDEAYGIGHVDAEYSDDEKADAKWPTEYLQRYADMEPMPRIPVYAGSGWVYAMLIQFDWDANTWITLDEVSQTDCNAFIEALRSAGWTNENTLSGNKVFDATNVPDGDDKTKGVWITVEYLNNTMRVSFQKVNARRKPWITYV